VHDIYLLPPNEDPETCVSWLRMRNKEGRYSLMFEEWVVDGDFIISPRIMFEVGTGGCGEGHGGLAGASLTFAT
jgi:hypothetical protein